MMNELFNQFLQILKESIFNIDDEYFSFHVAGNENTIERERIYCSELYHQIRNRFNNFPFSVNIEPDKKNHPYVEELCGPINPDIVIHNPGMMSAESNLAVIEVKRSSGNLTDGIVKDVQTINCMTTIENGYFGGIIIVFGQLTNVKKNNLISRIRENKADKTKKFIVILHNQVGVHLEIIEL